MNASTRPQPRHRWREYLAPRLPLALVATGLLLIVAGGIVLVGSDNGRALSRVAGIAAPPLPATLDRVIGAEPPHTDDAAEAPLDDGRDVTLSRPVAIPPDLGGGLAMPGRPHRGEPAGVVAARPVESLELPRLAIRVPVRLIPRDAVPDAPYAGWLAGTGFPGLSGNVVLAGHLDGPYAVFGELEWLRLGDEIRLVAGERVFVYVLTSLETVRSDALSVLDPTPDATLTLLTCAGNWDETTRRYDSRLVARAAFVATGIPAEQAED